LILGGRSFCGQADNYKSTYEISKFVDRMNKMFARGGARPISGWDQIDPLVFKPSEDAAEKVNEQLHCLARIKKLRYADLNCDEAAKAMCRDEEILETIKKLRTAFGEFVDLIDNYREIYKVKNKR